MSLGLAPIIVEGLLPVVREYARRAAAACSSSSSTSSSRSTVADRGYVLAHGEIVLQGEAEHLRTNHDLLISSYLGEHTGLFAGKEP